MAVNKPGLYAIYSCNTKSFFAIFSFEDDKEAFDSFKDFISKHYDFLLDMEHAKSGKYLLYHVGGIFMDATVDIHVFKPSNYRLINDFNVYDDSNLIVVSSERDKED